GLGPLIDYFGLELNAGPAGNPAVGQVVTFLGAGLYEEALFRLLLFSGLAALLRRAGAAARPRLAPAAVGSSLALRPPPPARALRRAVRGLQLPLPHHRRPLLRRALPVPRLRHRRRGARLLRRRRRRGRRLTRSPFLDAGAGGERGTASPGRAAQRRQPRSPLP